MFSRTLAIILSGTMMTAAFGLRTVRADAKESAGRASRARIGILKLGTGERARVEIKLLDDSRLKGYVGSIGADSFSIVTDAATGASRNIAFADVAQVKKVGNGFKTRTKVIIGAAVAAGALIGWHILKPALCDGGAQHRGPC